MILVKAASCTDSVHPSMAQIGRENGLSKQRITYANIVLQHAPELVDQVISGYVGLDGGQLDITCLLVLLCAHLNKRVDPAVWSKHPGPVAPTRYERANARPF